LKLGIYLTGAFGQSQELNKARNEAKRGRGPYEAVDRQVAKDTKAIVDAQQRLGFNFISDPMFRVDYLFQPFAERVPRVGYNSNDRAARLLSKFRADFARRLHKDKNVREGPQENWFDNNLFYTRPVISGNLETNSGGFTSRYLNLDLLTGGDKIAFLPSPYTLMALSIYGNSNGYELPSGIQQRLIKGIAQVILNEARDLAAKGFTRIQFDEPEIARRQSLGALTRTDLTLLDMALQICGKVEGAKTVLHTYFGNSGPILGNLKEMNVDGIGIDATETSLDSMLSQNFDGKELAVGLVDARVEIKEEPKKLAEKLERIADKTKSSGLFLVPNTGTELIGYTHGLEKMATLSAAKELFGK